MKYVDIIVRISPRTAPNYGVAVSSPQGSCESTLALPFRLEELEGLGFGVAQTVRDMIPVDLPGPEEGGTAGPETASPDHAAGADRAQTARPFRRTVVRSPVPGRRQVGPRQDHVRGPGAGRRDPHLAVDGPARRGHDRGRQPALGSRCGRRIPGAAGRVESNPALDGRPTSSSRRSRSPSSPRPDLLVLGRTGRDRDRSTSRKRNPSQRGFGGRCRT